MPTAWPEKDDNELLSLIQSGSSQAFSTLVERHTERFYRLAYRYLQSREAAEDAVQDAFIKLWENPGLWQPEKNSKFTTWFYRIVVNLCLDSRKRKTPRATGRWDAVNRRTRTDGRNDDTGSGAENARKRDRGAS